MTKGTIRATDAFPTPAPGEVASLLLIKIYVCGYKSSACNGRNWGKRETVERTDEACNLLSIGWLI